MNRVPVIIPNPANSEEVELNEDEVDPADLTPLISGDTPTVTVPALEDEDVAEEVVEDEDEEVIQGLERLNRELRSMMSQPLGDTSSRQYTVVPNVDVWDTGKAIEQEYRLHPDSTRMEVKDRLSDQVLDLLQILQERVNQHTCNDKDIRLIEGLKTILVLHSRLGVLTDTVLNRQAKKP